jgi:outer membrane protein assembly factor BamB
MDSTRTSRGRLFALGCLWTLLLTRGVNAGPSEEAAEIVRTTGVRGGIVVHLNCGDGRLTAALRTNEGTFVHGLDPDEQDVALARRTLLEQGVYGPVSIERLQGGALPYVDNLVNLVVAEGLGDVSRDEVLRVLVPQGVAYIREDGQWTKTIKPRPANIDDWTHYLHDPSGNAVAHDDVVGPPRHLQWLGDPRWSRHHDRMASMSALVSANGRLFYIMDEGSRISIQTPGDWKLVARDAFNGTILWKKPIADWQDHLWPLKSGPTQLARRLVAVGERVYVTLSYRSPLLCLDAITGETLHTFADSQSTEELLVDGGIVYALVNKGEPELKDYRASVNTGDQARVAKEFRWNEQPRELHAYEADSGRLLWSRVSKVAPLSLCLDAARLYLHDGEKVMAWDRSSGQDVWSSEPAPRRTDLQMNFGLRLVVHQDTVIFAGGERKMQAFDSATGKVLWSADHEKSGYQSPEDLLIVGGLVWSWPTTSGQDSGELTGRDPRTGEVKSKFAPNIDTYWFHHRCYIAKATDKYIMPSRTGIEFVDVAKQDWEIHHWVRGGCLYGVMPANGLLYAPPHNCACYPEAKLYGFNALAPASPSRQLPAVIDDAARLEKGPAYDAPVAPPAADAVGGNWPTFRHDARRSGRSPAALSPELAEAWDVALGGKLSSVVVDRGRLFVARLDTHQLHCLDAASGESLWSFTCGGPVDSPPTVFRGRVLFGCTDGWVYCLRESDGALIWRFRAAPMDRRIMAFERIESVWPVHGSVLVQDDAVAFVAGRSNFLDGGLRLIRLDVYTGQKITEKIMDDKDPETGENIQARLQTLQMPVGLADILSSDGSYLYMKSQRMDLDGNRLELGPFSGNSEEQGASQHGDGAHLFAPVGFLDDTYFHRAYWVYGRSFAGSHNGYYQAGRFAPSGRLLVFDGETVYGYGRKPEYYKWTTTIEHQLFAASQEPPPVPDDVKARRGAAATMIKFGKPPELDPTGKPFTVEAWIRSTQPAGVILAHGGPTRGYALALAGGKPEFILREADEIVTAAGPNEVVGTWTHLAGVLTRDKELKLYVDAKPVATVPVKSLLEGNPAQSLELGADDAGSVGDYRAPNGFTGAIDEVRIYHAALTDAEIAGRFAGQEVAQETAQAVVLSCSFDAGDAQDGSRHQLQGELTGAKATEGRSGQGMSFIGRANQSGGSFVRMNWTKDVPVYARAMVMAGETIFVAGPPDIIDEEATFKQIIAGVADVEQQLALQDEAFRGAKGSLLIAVSGQDGTLQTQYDLDAVPVWDGMAAAAGRLFMATTDGRVISLREAGAQ